MYQRNVEFKIFQKKYSLIFILPQNIAWGSTSLNFSEDSVAASNRECSIVVSMSRMLTSEGDVSFYTPYAPNSVVRPQD